MAAGEEAFEHAKVTVDCFHVVQLFTKAVDDVRKLEHQQNTLPNATRWAGLKSKGLTDKHKRALQEVEDGDFLPTIAWRIKAKWRWVRQAPTLRAARWRRTHVLRHARSMLTNAPELDAMRKALNPLHTQIPRILHRWTSTYSKARMEGLISLLQTARSRARGYRNTQTFIIMIYMIAAPLRFLFISS